MVSLKLHLDRWEARLQSLVEGSTARIFRGSSLAHDLSSGLLEAMRLGCRPAKQGGLEAPNLFLLTASPALAQALAVDGSLLDELAAGLHSAAVEAGFITSGQLALRLQVDDRLPSTAFRVQASFSQDGLADTQGMDTASEPDLAAPPRAFLIVDGTRVFALDRPVINIGRRSDNHLALDDPRISRLHAQLRLVRGRYVIFDLDSAGGTSVNGQRIRSQALLPGDVISLAGLPLIFGLEGRPDGETQEYRPPEVSQP